MLRAYIREQLAATWPMATASYLPLLARIAGASGLIAANAGLVTGQIREQLLSVINRGAVALIVDMRATASCDHAGADAIMRAYQRAVASGTELWLVVTAPVIGRVLSLNGLDRLILVYPSLREAITAGGAATGSSRSSEASP